MQRFFSKLFYKKHTGQNVLPASDVLGLECVCVCVCVCAVCEQ